MRELIKRLRGLPAELRSYWRVARGALARTREEQ